MNGIAGGHSAEFASAVPALFPLLFAMATLAEMLCETVVFSTLGRFNGGVANRAGVPIVALVVAGLVMVVALSRLVVRVTRNVMATRAHRLSHNPRAAHLLVAVKFSVGVAILSIVRLAVG